MNSLESGGRRIDNIYDFPGQISVCISPDRTSRVGSSSLITSASEVNLGNSKSTSFRDAFPCDHPKNPHMSTKKGRLQTFLDNSSIWPAHRIRATPHEIVDAGMYYLGERDRVKCWYCNGGLQNWERDDNPWEEHAKWFPLCEYVLQRKGLSYVQKVLSKFPGLQRPNFYRATPSSAVDVLREQLRSPPSSPPGSPAPVIIDPQKELREQQVNKEKENSEFVQMAKPMGFAEKQIYATPPKHYKEKGSSICDFSKMVEALIETSDGQEEPSSCTVAARRDKVTMNLTAEEKLRQLEGLRRCKICCDNRLGVVFLPCGHLVSCVKCAKYLEKCPSCKEIIHTKIKISLDTGKTF